MVAYVLSDIIHRNYKSNCFNFRGYLAFKFIFAEFSSQVYWSMCVAVALLLSLLSPSCVTVKIITQLSDNLPMNDKTLEIVA